MRRCTAGVVLLLLLAMPGSAGAQEVAPEPGFVGRFKGMARLVKDRLDGACRDTSRFSIEVSRDELTPYQAVIVDRRPRVFLKYQADSDLWNGATTHRWGKRVYRLDYRARLDRVIGTVTNRAQPQGDICEWKLSLTSRD
jgi:hypothetical protein